MADILYALAGEGRGHATRTKPVADELLARGHRIRFVTGDDSVAFLRPAYAGDARVSFVEVPVIRFGYTDRGGRRRVSLRATARNAWNFLLGLGRLADDTARRATENEFRPALLVSDYEALGWHVARRLRLPVVTLDNQHYFLYARLLSLPLRFWFYTILIGLTCRLMCPTRKASLIARPLAPEWIRRRRNVHVLGPIVRPEVRRAAAGKSEGDYVLAYLRPALEDAFLPALRIQGVPARVYGLGERPAEGNLEFRPVSADGFLRDLVGAGWVVTSAGNQTLGECLYLEKRTLLVPEPGQGEQEVNALQAKRWGIASVRHVTPEAVRDLLHSNTPRPHYPWEGDSTKRAADIVEGFLP